MEMNSSTLASPKETVPTRPTAQWMLVYDVHANHNRLTGSIKEPHRPQGRLEAHLGGRDDAGASNLFAVLELEDNVKGHGEDLADHDAEVGQARHALAPVALGDEDDGEGGEGDEEDELAAVEFGQWAPDDGTHSEAQDEEGDAEDGNLLGDLEVGLDL